MSDFFEIDPVTGIRTDFKWRESVQEYELTRSQNVEPVLNWTRAVKNEVGMNTEDIRRGWWLYAKLPPIVILQMRAKGINVYDKNDQKRMMAEINSNYPHLKCTTGNEGGKEKIIVA